MDFKKNCERFADLYKGEKPLTGSELVRDRLNAAEKASVPILAQVACMILFNHCVPEAISEEQAIEFSDKLDPIISAALDGRRVNQ
ncbi:hypothetical protein IWQ51_001714 [Labrenzia sp. EL_142]|nr:hypothetical protein [Labrenzia sp. EL_142]